MRIFIISHSIDNTTEKLLSRLANEGHTTAIASADKSTVASIRIGNSVERRLHRIAGYLTDSHNHHSTRATAHLLEAIADFHPHLIHILTVTGDYLNIHLLAYILNIYKIPTLLTLQSADDLIRPYPALLNRSEYNLKTLNQNFSTWDMLHIAHYPGCEMPDFAYQHPMYTITPGKEINDYLTIYDNIR